MIINRILCSCAALHKGFVPQGAVTPAQRLPMTSRQSRVLRIPRLRQANGCSMKCKTGASKDAPVFGHCSAVFPYRSELRRD